ncbi:hypothetical protein [Nocardioides terrisoli]|uniref:hypothetical protein n=1 Tax=Nocardioides terrisoli TaxID=3388267 RepID=UPI00287BC4B8|nr:hypothetical protein [Nocardioides marmorisolisilvae]
MSCLIKKFALLPVAALILAGLVAAGPAQAATVSPYPGTVRTHVKVHVNHHKKVRRHHTSAKLRPRVHIAVSGNAEPRGHVVVKVFRYRAHRTPHWKNVRTQVAPYRGSTRHVSLGRFRPGKFRVVVKYLPRNGSVYKHSKHTTRVTISK